MRLNRAHLGGAVVGAACLLGGWQLMASAREGDERAPAVADAATRAAEGRDATGRGVDQGGAPRHSLRPSSPSADRRQPRSKTARDGTSPASRDPDGKNAFAEAASGDRPGVAFASRRSALRPLLDGDEETFDALAPDVAVLVATEGDRAVVRLDGLDAAPAKVVWVERGGGVVERGDSIALAEIGDAAVRAVVLLDIPGGDGTSRASAPITSSSVAGLPAMGASR